LTEDSLPELLTAQVLDELIAKHRRYWPRLGPWTTPADRSRARWFRDQWIPLAVYDHGAWRLADSVADDVKNVEQLAAQTLASFDRAHNARSFRVGCYELVQDGFELSASGWRTNAPLLCMVPRVALELMREVLRLRWLERVLA